MKNTLQKQWQEILKKLNQMKEKQDELNNYLKGAKKEAEDYK